MTIWQFAAYSEAKMLSMQDELCLKVQAAYYNAYWNSGAKHKKSLNKILDNIRKDPYKLKEPIDVPEVEKQFRQMEELRTYGWTKE